MPRPALLLGILLAGSLTPLLGGLNPQQPGFQKPAPEVLKEITAKVALLYQRAEALKNKGLREPQLSDLMVYHRAAANVVKLDEFTNKDTAAWVLDALNDGLFRTSQAAAGEFPWYYITGQSVIRGYRSRVDGTVQPFAVTLPADYGKDPRKKWRLDVVLHGRDDGLNEAKFLNDHRAERAPPGQDFVRLVVFGRGNNAYRWAGETDVAEALDTFLATERKLNREQLLDSQRVVLRGFSMGGAGTWHIGLHRPDQWCLLGPGAGFVATHGYAKIPDKLPPYQEACLRIYDAIDYAENAFNVPVVAYAGAEDAQRKAALSIQEKLKPLGIPMQVLLAPGLGHTFPPEWQKKAEAAYAPFVKAGIPSYPKHVHYVTYTLKYPACHWVEVLGLEKHYERAVVDAERNQETDKTKEGFTVKTANVRALGLTLPPAPGRDQVILIDGQKVEALPWLMPNETYQVYLERKGGKWRHVLAQRIIVGRTKRPQKANGLVGPIDDAFRETFLCVRGSGAAKPWHPATNKYVEADLVRFKREWAKYFRGELPVKDDLDVTNDDIANNNLILLGDPGSNMLIGHVLEDLPLTWTREQIVLNGQKFSAADHVPVLIYPNPLNPSRYVVLNSGHTFHEADFKGTNALLYPRLGDFAVLRLTEPGGDPLAVQVVMAGLFDEYWQLPKK
jgi:predicted esterase